MIGDSLTTSVLQRALDGVWQRQKAISNNIANHDTPGYKARGVSFEEAIRREMNHLQGRKLTAKERRQAMQAVETAPIRSFENRQTLERADGNNVNMDVENIEMARAQIQYQYLTRGMTDLFARLRYAVSEGKK